MEQHKLEKGNLLDERGRLSEAGYATSLVKKYDRDSIRAGKLRIKEWDYYLIYNDSFGIALTVDDNAYMGMVSASFIDFRTPTERTKSLIFPFPMGKLHLPPTSRDGASEKSMKGCIASFTHEEGKRHLVLYMENFADKSPFHCELWLDEEPRDSMVIATPFEKKETAFYYNQKIIGMRAEGYVEYRGRTYSFDKTGSFGLLDWGRGVWTYSNTWYWGAAQGEQNGHRVGFNIGYGFGDTSKASENMFFYDGIAHKLEGVDFGIPQINGRDNLMSEWHMTSTDGRFNMTFTPIIDRCSNTDVLLICSKQHQVFGRYTGAVILDDGTEVKISDLLGFAEKVKNRW